MFLTARFFLLCGGYLRVSLSISSTLLAYKDSEGETFLRIGEMIHPLFSTKQKRHQHQDAPNINEKRNRKMN